MKMVYSNENRFLVSNAKNILEMAGVECVLRNEHVSSAIGEVSPFDAWVEVWVLEDEDYERGCKIIASSLSADDAQPWHCDVCQELNDASFELCWKCNTELDRTLGPD